MPRKKPEKGRPLGHKYPPKIDATPEEIAKVFFRRRPDDDLVMQEYRCAQCKREVAYPETLFKGGLCAECAEVGSG